MKRNHSSEQGSRLLLATLYLLCSVCFGQTLYQFGNPSPEEQLYIEYVNRARANPAAEGILLANTTDPDVAASMNYFGVNRTMLRNEMAAIPPSPPLAPNVSLTTSARGHSQWMLTNATQSHNQTNPANSPGQRITAAGYNFSTWGENIYAYCKNAFYGHAGFEVDWGPGGSGGMLAGRGHRVAIHSANYREIGVGVVNGTNGAIGPQLVTQNFGTQRSSSYFGTGVAYFDLNGNNFYDLGEAIPGLTVNISGSSSYCKTASGGGWVIPLPASTETTNRTITFSALGLQQSINITIPPNQNIKGDLKLNYIPPPITSPATAWVDSPLNFTFGAIPGAAAYQWKRWVLQNAALENCNDKSNVTMSLSGAYSGLNTTSKFEGTSSFQLVNGGSANDQFITLNPIFYGGTAPSVSFRSRVGLATSAILHKVQFQEVGSSVWQDCYSQAGAGPNAENTFTLRTINLSSMSGKSFKLRFFTSFSTGGTTYTSLGSGYGWMIDAIAFSNVFGLSNPSLETLTQPSAIFTPPAEGAYLMGIAPQISGTNFPASYQTLQVVAAPPPSFVTWATDLENLSGLALGTLVNSPNGDHDNDGFENLIEYGFGTSPVSSNGISDRMPTTRASETHFILTYQRDTALADLSFTPCVSGDIHSWKSPGQAGVPAEFIDILISTTNGIQTREASIPKTAMSNCFMTVQIKRN